MSTLLIALVLLLVLAILSIPVGFPGTWVIVGLAALWDWVSGTVAVGVTTLVAMLALAAGAEVLDMVLAGRYAQRYGGSRRAAWGAVLGGMAGAIIGVPVPIVGSVVGAFAGAFLGALIAEASRGTPATDAVRVATGALIGRAVAAAVRVGIACIMAVWLLVAVTR